MITIVKDNQRLKVSRGAYEIYYKKLGYQTEKKKVETKKTEVKVEPEKTGTYQAPTENEVKNKNKKQED